MRFRNIGEWLIAPVSVFDYNSFVGVEKGERKRAGDRSRKEARQREERRRGKFLAGTCDEGPLTLTNNY